MEFVFICNLVALSCTLLYLKNVWLRFKVLIIVMLYMNQMFAVL